MIENSLTAYYKRARTLPPTSRSVLTFFENAIDTPLPLKEQLSYLCADFGEDIVSESVLVLKARGLLHLGRIGEHLSTYSSVLRMSAIELFEWKQRRIHAEDENRMTLYIPADYMPPALYIAEMRRIEVID